MNTVLAIDDSTTRQLMLGAQLRDSGFTLLTAGSLREAEQQLHEASIILVELLLVNDNGFQIATRLRPRCLCPLILMSSRKIGADRSWSQARGFSHLIHRPLPRPRLIALLESCTGKEPECPD